MRQSIIQRSHKTWGTIWPGCAPSIADAIHLCQEIFSSSDTTSGAVRSVRKKIRKHLDPALDAWTKKQSISPLEGNFSTLLAHNRNAADIAIQQWGMEVVEDIQTRSRCRVKDLEEVFATVDSLRSFLRLSFSYTPNLFPVIRVDDNGEVSIDAKEAWRREGKQRRDAVPWHLFVDHEGACELCLEPTEATNEAEKYLSRGLSKDKIIFETTQLLLRGAALISQGFSQQYCESHVRAHGGESRKRYDRDSERRVYFYSVIRLLVLIQAVTEIPKLTPEMRRSHAHAIVYTNGHVSKPLRILPDLLGNYENCSDSARGDINEMLLEHLRKIVAMAEKKGYDPVAATKRGIALEHDWIRKFNRRFGDLLTAQDACWHHTGCG